MQTLPIDEVKPQKGAVFVDNLMLCSADRLTSSRYDPEYLGTLTGPLPSLLFLHDIINLSHFVQALVCHEYLYVNAEYVDRWNSEIWPSTLALLGQVIVPLSWSGESRGDVERRLWDAVSVIQEDTGLSEFSYIVFRATHHHEPLGRGLVHRLFLPHEEADRQAGSVQIAINTVFYLMCSQLLGVPYKPSVLRSSLLGRFINSAFESQHFTAADVALTLLEKDREAAAREYFQRILEFNLIDTHIPCVLAAVLREARSPRDVVRVTKEMRETKGAIQFRKWTGEFASAIQDGDLSEIGRFVADLRGVTADVRKELGVVETLDDSIQIGWGPVALGHAFSLPKILRKPIYFKRHLWFLHDLYKSAMTMARIADEIQRVFVRSLPGSMQENLGRFDWRANLAKARWDTGIHRDG